MGLKVIDGTPEAISNYLTERENQMDKKELKKLMTQLAKGKISQKEVDLLIKPKKVHQNQSHREKSTHTRKRKQVLKKKGELQ